MMTFKKILDDVFEALIKGFILAFSIVFVIIFMFVNAVNKNNYAKMNLKEGWLNVFFPGGASMRWRVW